jgi:hypothetical protein
MSDSATANSLVWDLRCELGRRRTGAVQKWHACFTWLIVASIGLPVTDALGVGSRAGGENGDDYLTISLRKRKLPEVGRVWVHKWQLRTMHIYKGILSLRTCSSSTYDSFETRMAACFETLPYAELVWENVNLLHINWYLLISFDKVSFISSCKLIITAPLLPILNIPI